MIAMKARALVALLAFSVMGAMPSQNPNVQIANAETANPNIGPPPVPNPADYTPYMQKGSNTLAFNWALRFTNGNFQECTPQHDYALLYPATPYTRWLLHRFALDTVGHVVKMGRAVPGDTGFAVVAPAYLQAFNKSGAVRSASCVNGWVAFHNVPLGNYIAIGEIGHIDQGGTPGNRVTVEATYNPVLGMPVEQEKEEFDPHSTIDVTTDAYLMISAQYNIVKNVAAPITDTIVLTYGHYDL